MLFMVVFSYQAKHRNEVVKRRLTLGSQLPEGVKSMGEWSYIGSGKVFRLVEATDTTAMFKANYAWSDLGTLEMYPVIAVDQVMGMISAMGK
jgi:hypothetical protein